MANIQFKKIGWFVDENSARYQAQINKYVKVNIWKCYYMKGFRFSFLTIDDYSLDTITGDLLSCFWDNATKKDTIQYINNLVNVPEVLEQLNSESILITQLMTRHTKNNNNGKSN
jgi:hypothetical protein